MPTAPSCCGTCTRLGHRRRDTICCNSLLLSACLTFRPARTVGSRLGAELCTCTPVNNMLCHVTLSHRLLATASAITAASTRADPLLFLLLLLLLLLPTAIIACTAAGEYRCCNCCTTSCSAAVPWACFNRLTSRTSAAAVPGLLPLGIQALLLPMRGPPSRIRMGPNCKAHKQDRKHKGRLSTCRILRCSGAHI